MHGRVLLLAAAMSLAPCAVGDGPAAVMGEKVRIRLSTGEVLTVEVIEQTDETIRFVHPVLGEFTVPRANVTILPPEDAAVTPEEAQAKAAAEAAAGAAEQAAGAGTPSVPESPATAPAETQPTTQPTTAPVPLPPPKEWKFTLVLGGALADGNTETGSITSTFTILRERPLDRMLMDAGYFYGSANGDTTENHFTAGIRHDWLNPGSKWFLFGDARYDYDQFQSWDHRFQTHGGVGYRLIEPPKWKINLLMGAGVIKEFGSDNEDWRPEALLGIEGEWQIADYHRIVFASTFFPDLGDWGEYRVSSSAGWSYLLDQKARLSLTAGVQHEYQSIVDPGNKHYDLRAFVGLQLDW
jgi:hypothetical protein